MPYIDMRKFKEGIVMVETVRKNFKKITKEDIEMAKLSRETEAMIGDLSDSVFKRIVSDKDLKNCRVKVNDDSNDHSILGTNHDRLEGAY